MSHYLHGTHPEEQNRLSRLNDLINFRCLPELNLQRGFKVLDVGSGLGQMTYQISNSIGQEGNVIGIERDTDQINLARKFHRNENLEFRQGDALQLPLSKSEWNSFDLVHTRFLLEHLSNPTLAISEMLKALKPGGRILLADDDHQAMILYPEPPGFQALWTAYMDSYVAVGNDPFIGRKLPRLLLENGFSNITNNIVFFGDCAGTPTFKFFVDNLIEVILPSFEVMIANRLISEKEFVEGIQNIKDWSSIRYATLWYSICIAEGVKQN